MLSQTTVQDFDQDYSDYLDYQNQCADEAYQKLLEERGSGRRPDELDRATAQFLCELELQAQTIAPQTFHFYITVEHPIKGEHGFYLDTVSDRFVDVMNAIRARRQDLGLFGYRFVESIDLGTLPF